MTAINRNSPTPQGRYVPARRYGDLIFVAGVTPRENGVLRHAGQADPQASPDLYRPAAELATHLAIEAALTELRPGERLGAILSLTVWINAPCGYEQHSRIADFASEFIEHRLPAIGLPARAAIGASSLPGGALLELQLVAAAAPA